jgi:hypothetical protein
VSDVVEVTVVTSGVRQVQPFRTVAGVTDTLVLADHLKTVEYTNPAGCVVTVPDDVFSAGHVVTVATYAGAGPVTFAGDAVAVARPGLDTVQGDGGGASLHFRSPSEYYLWGDLT